MHDAVTNRHPFEEASMYNLLGLIADHENRNAAALDNFYKALTIRRRQDYKAGIASTLLNIGILFEKQGRFQEALTMTCKAWPWRSLFNMASEWLTLTRVWASCTPSSNAFDKANEFLAKAERISRSITRKIFSATSLKTNADCSTCKAALRLFATQGLMKYSRTHCSIKISLTGSCSSERF